MERRYSELLTFSCVFVCRSFFACLSGHRSETGHYWSRHRFFKERRHALLRIYDIQALYCILILSSGNVRLWRGDAYETGDYWRGDRCLTERRSLGTLTVLFFVKTMIIYPGLLVRLCGAEIAQRQVIMVAEIGISRSGDGFFVDCCSKSSIFTVFV